MYQHGASRHWKAAAGFPPRAGITAPLPSTPPPCTKRERATADAEGNGVVTVTVWSPSATGTPKPSAESLRTSEHWSRNITAKP